MHEFEAAVWPALTIAVVGIIGAAGKYAIAWLQARSVSNAIDYVDAQRSAPIKVSDNDAKLLMIDRAHARLPPLFRPPRVELARMIEGRANGSLRRDSAVPPSDPPKRNDT